VLYSSLSPLYALRHQSRPPFVVVDFRITPPRARRTLRPTNRNTLGGGAPEVVAPPVTLPEVVPVEDEGAAVPVGLAGGLVGELMAMEDIDRERG
jgi:hypothetical protein